MTTKRAKYRGEPHRMTEIEFTDLAGRDAGICLFCRQTTEGGIEPDARGYACESCGTPGVYGLEELLIMGMIEFTDEGDDQ